MNGELVVENALSHDGMRSLHVMSSELVNKGWLDCIPDAIKGQDKVEIWEDNMRFHHLQARWPAREVVPWMFLRQPFPVIRKMALWWMGEGWTVSAAMAKAAECYALGTGVDAEFTWIRTIPSRKVEGVEFDGMMLIQASWVPAGFVAVGRGGDLVAQVPTFKRTPGHTPALLMGKQEKLGL